MLLRRPVLQIVRLFRTQKLLAIAISLTFGSTLLIAGTTAFLARQVGSESVSNALTTYEDILPGQLYSIPALQAQGFSCVLNEAIKPGHEATCAQTIETGPVAELSIKLGSDAITHTHFNFRDSGLSVGDLVRRWGSPKIQTGNNLVSLLWTHPRITATAQSSSGRFTYFDTVQSLSIGT